MTEDQKLIADARTLAHQQAETHRWLIDRQYGPDYESMKAENTLFWKLADRLEASLSDLQKVQTTPEGWKEMAETAARTLAEIPKPRVNDGAHVVWAVSDDVPESISVAQSWIVAMLSAAPAPEGGEGWKTIDSAPKDEVPGMNPPLTDEAKT